MKKMIWCCLMFFLGLTAVQNVSAEVEGGSPVVEKCEELSSLFDHPGTVLTEVALAEEGSVEAKGIGLMPEHCIVKGKMNERVSPVDGNSYAIGFEMRLPAKWNGRFFYQANGGLDGRVAGAFGNILGGGPVSNGLLKGFAVISSDAGHAMDRSVPTGGGSFGIDPQARIDYGYNAVAQLTLMAKALIETYYGKGPEKSYFVGTSNGGRHTMVAASRYADQYDGFLASSPGFNLPKAAVAQLWGVQQYATISKMDPETGRPDITSSFSQDDRSLVAKAILEKCDSLDGADDDMVSDTLGCQAVFNIHRDVPTCQDAPDGKCLTYGQKQVLAAVHAGAKNSKGEDLYRNFLWDVGIGSPGWAGWKFENSTGPRDPLAVGFVFTVPPQDPKVLDGSGTTTLDYALNWDGLGFDVNVDAEKIYATDETYTEAAMSFMPPPDFLFSDLQKAGGKLMVVHGSADPVFSVADTIDWYERFSTHYGDAASDTARFFIVPGMGHSRGGPATDQYDMVDALVKWVESGTAPEMVIATARGAGANVENPEVPSSWAPNRTRPLCAYPKVAQYMGSGSLDEASNFSCVKP